MSDRFLLRVLLLEGLQLADCGRSLVEIDFPLADIHAVR
jgi:hypothetical protein